MTEELKQKAEEYIKKDGTKTEKLLNSVKLSLTREEATVLINSIKQSYIDGATENGIQWHDLRKDPNDLPKGQINRFLFAYVKNYGGKKPMLVCYNGEWFYDANTYNDEVKVIQWCEIPQFKE